MRTEAVNTNERKMTSIFERYLSVWVLLCIGGGILMGKICLNTQSWFRYEGHGS